MGRQEKEAGQGLKPGSVVPPCLLMLACQQDRKQQRPTPPALQAAPIVVPPSALAGHEEEEGEDDRAFLKVLTGFEDEESYSLKPCWRLLGLSHWDVELDKWEAEIGPEGIEERVHFRWSLGAVLYMAKTTASRSLVTAALQDLLRPVRRRRAAVDDVLGQADPVKMLQLEQVRSTRRGPAADSS